MTSLYEFSQSNQQLQARNLQLRSEIFDGGRLVKDVVQIILKCGYNGTLADCERYISTESINYVLNHHPEKFALLSDTLTMEIPVLEICKMPTCIGNCKRLHLCRNIILNHTCERGENCNFEHYLQTEKNIQYLQQFYLDECDLETISQVYNTQRNKQKHVKLCLLYQTNHCKFGDLNCYNLHLCKYFMENRCTKGSFCNLSHDISNKICQSKLKNLGYNVNKKPAQLLEDIQRNIGIYSPVSKQVREFQQKPANNNLEENICTYNLGGICKFGRNCKLRHTKTTYVWDYETAQGWKEFESDLSDQLELAYSAPNLKDNLILQQPYAAKFDFVQMVYILKNQPTCKIRRISTESSCSNATHRFTTDYKWFFLNEEDIYEKFGHRLLPSFKNCPIEDIVDSDFIERSYLSDSVNIVISYTIDSWNYELNFANMLQKNLCTGVERPVKRRPVDIKLSEDDSPQIVCLYHCHKPGSCLYGSACHFKHTQDISLPYLWQLRKLPVDDSDLWENYANGDVYFQEKLEEFFCNIKLGLLCSLSLGPDQKTHVLNVDEMVAWPENTSASAPPQPTYQLRRLSTVSENTNSKKHLQPFTTKYRWYWFDDNNNWNIFGPGSELSSEKLEEALHAKRTNIEFTASGTKYRIEKINNLGAVQVNYATNFSHPIHRRPVFVSANDIEQLRKSGNEAAASQSALSDSQFQYPPEWDMKIMSDKPDLDFHLITVDASTPEFNKVNSLLTATLRSVRLVKLERIQNIFLWQAYSLRKKKLEKTRGVHGSNEHVLFHGTQQSSVYPIAQQGFDHRLSGSVTGQAYGQGSYFSASANYSFQYTRGCNCMFLVKVLVGDFTVGSCNMRRPPPKSVFMPNGDLYDSTVDNASNPSIFVIYNTDQAYPAYIMHFQ